MNLLAVTGKAARPASLRADEGAYEKFDRGAQVQALERQLRLAGSAAEEAQRRLTAKQRRGDRQHEDLSKPNSCFFSDGLDSIEP